MTKRYHVSRTINAAPETVWNLLTDATSYAAWNPAVISIVGPIEVGNTIELVSIVNPKRTFKLKVTTMQAPRTMVWSDGMPLGLFTGTRTFRVEPGGEGASFSMTEEYTGPLSGLIVKTIPDMTDSFEQFANGLKTAAETAA